MSSRVLLPIRKVADKIGRSKSWIRTQLADAASDFPRPLELDGYVRQVFDAASIDQWIDSRISRAREKREQQPAVLAEVRA